MTAVWSPTLAWAAAGLPRSTTPAGSPSGSIALLEGAAGWPSLVRQALDAGAVAVAVVEPCWVAAGESDMLRAAPIVLERPALALIDGIPAVRPLLVSAEVAGADSVLRSLLADAIAIARRLGGGATLARTGSTADSWFAALAGPIPASLLVDALPGPAGMLRVVASGDVDVEVVIDRAAMTERVAVADAGGMRVSARQLEAPPRRALRRALAAAAGGAPVGDLDGFAVDCALAHQVLSNDTPAVL